MPVKALDIPADEDLSEFAASLWQQQVPHRIRFHQGVQELWLANPADVEWVLSQYQRWKEQGELPDPDSRQQATTSSGFKPALLMRQAPITLSLLTISLALTLLTGFGRQMEWLRYFTFVDFNFQGQSLLFQSIHTLWAGPEVWRWLTPIFLHFSLLHLIFNMLWMWELGRRIERLYQPGVLIVLVLFTGVSSNIAQFLMTGPLFGGLSGVIFGLLAYTWLWDRICPEHPFGLPPILMTLMVIWLLAGVSGLLEAFGFGSIANTAHLVGLVSGLVAVPVVYVFRQRLYR